MSNNHNTGAGSVLMAFVIGALTGAAAALLFAPAAGDETRDYIGKKAREGRDRARDAVDQGRDVYQRNRENVSTAIERGREAFQQARERGEQA